MILFIKIITYITISHFIKIEYLYEILVMEERFFTNKLKQTTSLVGFDTDFSNVVNRCEPRNFFIRENNDVEDMFCHVVGKLNDDRRVGRRFVPFDLDGIATPNEEPAAMFCDELRHLREVLANPI